MVEIDEKQIFAVLQKAKDSGSIKVGANEATKAVERGQAKLVVTASDVSPAEIVAHFPGLCKEMNIAFANIGTRAELGTAVGIKSTTAIVVIDAGAAKKELEVLTADLLEPVKVEKEVVEAPEEVKAEKEEVETPKEVKEEVKAEAKE